MSYSRKLYLEEHKRLGARQFTLNGTPAECINLAIYNLFSSKPDLVVSGINEGKNTGL